MFKTERLIQNCKTITKIVFWVLVPVLTFIILLLLINYILIFFFPVFESIITNPLFQVLYQIFLGSGSLLVIGGGIYTLYRAWLKGPSINMISEREGGISRIVYEVVPVNTRRGVFSPFVDVIFYNDGSRAGIVKEFQKSFVPTPELDAFLIDEPFHVHPSSTIINIEAGKTEAIRLEVQLVLRIQTDADVGKWIEFLKGNHLLGQFHFSAKRSNREGKILPFSEKTVPVYPTQELVEDFSNPPKR